MPTPFLLDKQFLFCLRIFSAIFSKKYIYDYFQVSLFINLKNLLKKTKSGYSFLFLCLYLAVWVCLKMGSPNMVFVVLLQIGPKILAVLYLLIQETRIKQLLKLHAGTYTGTTFTRSQKMFLSSLRVPSSQVIQNFWEIPDLFEIWDFAKVF